MKKDKKVGKERKAKYREKLGDEEELDDSDQEIMELLQKIEQGILALDSMSEDEKPQAIKKLVSQCQKTKGVLQSFKVEIKELPKDKAAAYEEKVREHQSTLQRLHTDVIWAKTASEKANLLGSSNGAGTSGVEMKDLNNLSSKELLDEAKSTQDASSRSVANSRRMIEESKEIGVATTTRLKEQTDQLKGIDKDMVTIESHLKRADKVLRGIMRRLMTDKIILFFLFLIVVGIIIIIIYKALFPKQAYEEGFRVPDELGPPKIHYTNNDDAQTESPATQAPAESSESKGDGGVTIHFGGRS